MSPVCLEKWNVYRCYWIISFIKATRNWTYWKCICVSTGMNQTYVCECIFFFYYCFMKITVIIRFSKSLTFFKVQQFCSLTFPHNAKWTNLFWHVTDQDVAMSHTVLHTCAHVHILYVMSALLAYIRCSLEPSISIVTYKPLFTLLCFLFLMKETKQIEDLGF